MKVVKNELFKLNYSLQGRVMVGTISFLAVFLLFVFFFSTNATERSSLAFIIFIISNIQNTYILIFVSIIATTFLFAKEFQDKTYIYVFLRPVFWPRLFLGKILAVMLFICEIIVGVMLVSGLIGIFMFDIKPINEFDHNIVESIGRVLGYSFILLLSFIFSISIASVMSILLRNQLGSAIGSLILFFFCIIFMITIFPENSYSYTPFYYIFFSQYLQKLPSGDIAMMVFRGIAVLIGYSSVPIGIAYNTSSKIRKGQKSV